jgi:hypothetical protein
MPIETWRSDRLQATLTYLCLGLGVRPFQTIKKFSPTQTDLVRLNLPLQITIRT